MNDMLVRLYALPDTTDLKTNLSQDGILIRRPNPFERHLVTSFIAEHFSPKWVSECKVAFSRQPIGCVIATQNKKVLGFACFDVTSRGFLGPMGIAPEARMSGLGKALLVDALEKLRELGYAYGIIGGVGPAEFYTKSVGATIIEGSDPGIYVDILPEPQK